MRVWDLVSPRGVGRTLRGPVPCTGDVVELEGIAHRVGEVRHLYRVTDDGVPEHVGTQVHVGASWPMCS